MDVGMRGDVVESAVLWGRAGVVSVDACQQGVGDR